MTVARHRHCGDRPLVATQCLDDLLRLDVVDVHFVFDGCYGDVAAVCTDAQINNLREKKYSGNSVLKRILRSEIETIQSVID